MNDEFLKLDNQLCFAVYSASHAFTKTYRPMLEALDLTYPQYLAMLVLWEKRVASVTEIGAALGLDSGTLSPLLKRLEKTGYIRRERSKEDERQVAIHLTQEGAVLRERAKAVVDRIGAATGCNLDELIDLVSKLKTLRGNLESA